MRIRTITLGAATAVLLVACVMGVWIRTNSPTTSIAQTKRNFLEGRSPIFEFSLETYVSERRKYPDLNDPILTLPQWARYEAHSVQALDRYSRLCDQNLRVSLESKLLDFNLRKAFQWARFQCHDLAQLPAGFLESKPLMHPSGKSYAFLLFEKVRALDESHLHLLETLNLQLQSKELLPLTAWQLQNLLHDESITLAQKMVILRSEEQVQRGNRTFLVYPESMWNAYLSDTAFLTSVDPSPGSPCLLREGNVCWSEDTTQRQVWLRGAIALLLISLMLALGALVVFELRRIENQKRGAEQQLFILQMLTHELRTPIASLKLSLESIRRDFDHLPIESQKSFLRMCDELQRLGRVADASQDYLRAPDPTRAFTPNSSTSIALRDFAERIVEAYPGVPLLVDPIGEDRLTADPYWLELCVRNLIDNAFSHGLPPVRFKVLRDERGLRLEVTDEGRDGSAANERAHRPGGLGLGLILVEKTIIALGGRLSRTHQPTTFTLHFPESLCQKS